MRFLHIIITRFNMGLYKNSISYANNWMANRLKLFDTFCYPSIMSQTNKNFIWTVLFDIRTPQIWRNAFLRYKKCPQFIPIFADTNGRYQILKLGRNNKKIDTLITTRFDNDDAISIHAVDTIQKNIPDYRVGFVNLSKGYTYDVHRRELFEFQSRANAFITAVEYPKSAKTILGYGNHAVLKNKCPEKIVNVEDDRYWMQVIHGNNLYNTARGKQVGLDTFKNFGVKL